MKRQSEWLRVAATIALAFTATTIEIGGGVARGESVWYNMRRKEKQIWQQNADIVVRRATGTDARTVQTGFTSTVTTRSTVNGAALQVTDTGVRTVQTGFTGMVRVATSASGVDRPQTARVVHTLLRTAMKSNDNEDIAEQRAETAEALRFALAELESGEALSDFVEGHGLQSRYFVFSWQSDWLSISYRLPYARVLSGEDEMSLDNARIGAAIRMAILLLASDSGESFLHDGEAELSVEAGEFGVRYDITGPDGEEIDSADDWQPLIARLENDLPSAGESLHIIWP